MHTIMIVVFLNAVYHSFFYLRLKRFVFNGSNFRFSINKILDRYNSFARFHTCVSVFCRMVQVERIKFFPIEFHTI